MYIHDGNGKLYSSLRQFIHNILASFSNQAKDNTKIDTYPKKPYLELDREKKAQEKEEKKNDSYKKYEESLVYYGTLKQQYLDRLQKKKGE